MNDEVKGPHASPLRASLPPRGALFALGRPGGKKKAPTLRRCAPRCPPGGCFLPWGGPAAKKGPHASPPRASLPQGGCFLPWGSPRQKKARNA
ncbi:MAG: hypothetical protein EPN46_10950 [Candidimonas sp.]|nr:MAG: hypothetical protein EPN46_10950 [Candidimonas sp.]